MNTFFIMQEEDGDDDINPGIPPDGFGSLDEALAGLNPGDKADALPKEAQAGKCKQFKVIVVWSSGGNQTTDTFTITCGSDVTTFVYPEIATIKDYLLNLPSGYSKEGIIPWQNLLEGNFTIDSVTSENPVEIDCPEIPENPEVDDPLVPVDPDNPPSDQPGDQPKPKPEEVKGLTLETGCKDPRTITTDVVYPNDLLKICFFDPFYKFINTNLLKNGRLRFYMELTEDSNLDNFGRPMPFNFNPQGATVPVNPNGSFSAENNTFTIFSIKGILGEEETLSIYPMFTVNNIFFLVPQERGQDNITAEVTWNFAIEYVINFGIKLDANFRCGDNTKTSKINIKPSRNDGFVDNIKLSLTQRVGMQPVVVNGQKLTHKGNTLYQILPIDCSNCEEGKVGTKSCPKCSGAGLVSPSFLSLLESSTPDTKITPITDDPETEANEDQGSFITYDGNNFIWNSQIVNNSLRTKIDPFIQKAIEQLSTDTDCPCCLESINNFELSTAKVTFIAQNIKTFNGVSIAPKDRKDLNPPQNPRIPGPRI